MSATALRLDAKLGGYLPHFAPEDVVLSVSICLDRVQAEWRAFERFAAGTVYQSYDWVSNWHSAIGLRQGVTPYIVLARAPDGRVLFLLPLGILSARGLRSLVWLGGKQADVKGGLFAPEFLAGLKDQVWKTLWHRLCDQMPDVDVIHLADQPSEIGGHRNPFAALATHVMADRIHATRLGSDWKKFYAEKRSGSARRRDRQLAKKFDGMGKTRLEIVHSADAIVTLAQKLFAQKSESLGAMGISDPFAAPEVCGFYNRLARLGVPRGCVHVSALTLDNVPVSIAWGYVFSGCYYYVIPTYDPKLYLLSPGRVHLTELFRWCVENGLRRVDMGVGDQPYKFDWCDEHLALFSVIAGRSLKGRLAASALGAKASLKRAIKSSGTLWPLVQSVRAVFGRRAVPSA